MDFGRETLVLVRRVFEPCELPVYVHNFGVTLALVARLEEAEAHLREALELVERCEDSSLMRLDTQEKLAEVLIHRGEERVQRLGQAVYSPWRASELSSPTSPSGFKLMRLLLLSLFAISPLAAWAAVPGAVTAKPDASQSDPVILLTTEPVFPSTLAPEGTLAPVAGPFRRVHRAALPVDRGHAVRMRGAWRHGAERPAPVGPIR